MGIFSKFTGRKTAALSSRRSDPGAPPTKPGAAPSPRALAHVATHDASLKVAVAPPAPSSAHAPCRFIVTPHKLGSGAYGSVLMGSDAASAQVAIKIVADGRMKPAALDREVALLERLSEAQHPSLMCFFGYFPPAAVRAGAVRAESAEPLPLPTALGGCHCIVMEMARGGELFERVVKAGGYGERRAAPLFAQLCGAVGAAHELGIVHRDLKLENVLYMGTEAEGPETAEVVKLIDWGLAHQHAIGPDGRPVPERLHSRCGSRSYMAPEVADRQQSSAVGYDGFKADVWSLGVCLFAIHLGFFPFEQSEPEVDWRARRVRDAQREGASTVRTIFTFYPRKTLSLSPQLVHLIDSMLVFDPSRRASLTEVMGSAWLAPHVAALGGGACAPMDVDVDGPKLAAHRRTSSGGSIGYSTSDAYTPSSSPRSDSYSFTSTPTRSSSRPPSTFEGLSESQLERQDSTSTAYSVSSVGSSVIQSMSRLRYMAAQSHHHHARDGRREGSSSGRGYDGGGSTPGRYEAQRPYRHAQPTPRYDRAFHEAYGAPASAAPFEFELETRYAVAGGRSGGSGGSGGLGGRSGSKSGSGHREAERGGNQAALAKKGSRERSGGRRYHEGLDVRMGSSSSMDAEHAAACEAAGRRGARPGGRSRDETTPGARVRSRDDPPVGCE